VLTQIVFIMLMVHEIKKKTLMSGELINGLFEKAQRCNSFRGISESHLQLHGSEHF